MKRDLTKAEWLRPREITDIYGLSQSSISELCTSKRLPHRKVIGKSGRRGMVFIKREDMDAFMAGGAAA